MHGPGELSVFLGAAMRDTSRGVEHFRSTLPRFRHQRASVSIQVPLCLQPIRVGSCWLHFGISVASSLTAGCPRQ